MSSRHFKASLAKLALSLAIAATPALTVADTARSPQAFATPEAAVDALVAASREHKRGALKPLLGSEGESLFHTTDRTADHTGHDRFGSAYAEAHHLDYETPDRAILIVGKEDWPMPVPLVHTAAGWQFDAQAGKQEILNRRIGHNELDVIEVCRAFVLAQHEYASLHATAGHPEFARALNSHGKNHDGLYWQTSGNEPNSPLGALVAGAAVGSAEPHTTSPKPYHGYFFRVLTQQGPHASGGARNYMVDGHMTGGFALVAYPARYGETGVMTFLVGQSGIVREKNLGADTHKVVEAMEAYDPDPSWSASKTTAPPAPSR